MALQSEGEISASNLNDQVRRPTTQAVSLNDAQLRGLAKKPSGAIKLSDFYGKWAGSRMVCGYSSADQIYGFKSGVIGSIIGDFAGANLKSCYWLNVTGWYILNMETVSGATKPTSRTIKITDDNFNLIGTYTLSEWTASGSSWTAAVAVASNPFPNGSVRWFTW